MKSRNSKATVTRDYAGVTLSLGGKQVKLGAGTRDRVIVRDIGDDIVVMACNNHLGYYGLEVYNKDLTMVNEIFLQSPEEVESACGPRFEGLQFRNQLKALYSLACEAL